MLLWQTSGWKPVFELSQLKYGVLLEHTQDIVTRYTTSLDILFEMHRTQNLPLFLAFPVTLTIFLERSAPLLIIFLLMDLTICRGLQDLTTRLTPTGRAPSDLVGWHILWPESLQTGGISVSEQRNKNSDRGIVFSNVYLIWSAIHTCKVRKSLKTGKLSI